MRDEGYDERVFILAGVMPVRSAKALEYMLESVPGMSIADEYIARMESAADPKEEGVAICVETIKRLRETPGVKGVHIMPVMWESITPRIVEEAGLLPRPVIAGVRGRETLAQRGRILRGRETLARARQPHGGGGAMSKFGKAIAAFCEKHGFLGKCAVVAENVVKKPVFGCQDCGQCVLSYDAFTCPMRCPKQIRNGPCGGTRADGHCEVYPERRCIWWLIYERSERWAAWPSCASITFPWTGGSSTPARG